MTPTPILALLFVSGVVWFVHYLGHALAGRRIGVRVTPFSLGFGRQFLSKTKWQRFQVLIMGPAMNFLLAVVALAVVFAQGIEVPTYMDEPAVIGKVVPGSLAEQAGLRAGDRITRVVDEPVATWAELEVDIGKRPKRDVQISFVREGQTLEAQLKTLAEARYELSVIGMQPKSTTVVRAVEKGEPADRAGVRSGDEIIAVNGEPILTAADVRPAVQKSTDHEIELTIRRDGQEQQLRMTAAPMPAGPRIGLVPVPATKRVRVGRIEAVKKSVAGNYASTMLVFRTLGEIVIGRTSARTVMGPVEIGELSGKAAQAGWIPLLSLTSILSLNIGILNLLPVPLLDGWYILIIGLEGLLRRDFSLQVKDKMLLAGFVVLTTLIVLYNIARIG